MKKYIVYSLLCMMVYPLYAEQADTESKQQNPWEVATKAALIGAGQGFSEFWTGRPFENMMLQAIKNNVLREQAVKENKPFQKIKIPLYAGSKAHLVGIVPATITQVLLNEGFKQANPDHPFVNATLAGLLSTIVVTPCDMTTLKLVNAQNERAEKLGQEHVAKILAEPKKNLRDCIKEIYAQYGAKGFYRGWFEGALREGKFAPGYLWLVPELKKFYGKYKEYYGKYPEYVIPILAGATAGIPLSLFSHPDKTVGLWQQDGRANSTFDALKKMSQRDEGRSFKQLLKQLYVGKWARAARYSTALAILDLSGQILKWYLGVEGQT